MRKYFFSIIIILNINLIYNNIELLIRDLPEEYYISSYKSKSRNDLIYRELISPLLITMKFGFGLGKDLSLLLKPKTNYFLIASCNPLVNSTINYTTKIFYNLEKFNFYNETNSSHYHKSGECKNFTLGKNNVPIAEQICPVSDTFQYSALSGYKTHISRNTIMHYNMARNIKDNITGIIGLNLFDEKNEVSETSFLSKLKELKIINDYFWYFDEYTINKIENKRIIIDILPHHLNITNETNLFFTENNNTNNSNKFWEMKFDNIYINNNEKINLPDKEIEFRFDTNATLGTIEYKKYLESNIKDLVTEKICAKGQLSAFDDEFNNISSVYEYYYCLKKNITMDELSYKIPPLFFYSKELQFTFEITKNEILVEKGNFIFIKILFNKNTTKANKWIVGKQFIFKYKFIFNSYTGKIGFYNPYKRNSLDNSEKKDSKDKFYKLLIIIILIIYLCVGPIIIAWNKLNNKQNEEKKDKKVDDEKKEDDENKIGLINENDKDEEEKKNIN